MLSSVSLGLTATSSRNWGGEEEWGLCVGRNDASGWLAGRWWQPGSALCRFPPAGRPLGTARRSTGTGRAATGMAGWLAGPPAPHQTAGWIPPHHCRGTCSCPAAQARWGQRWPLPPPWQPRRRQPAGRLPEPGRLQHLSAAHACGQRDDGRCRCNGEGAWQWQHRPAAAAAVHTWTGQRRPAGSAIAAWAVLG